MINYIKEKIIFKRDLQVLLNKFDHKEVVKFICLTYEFYNDLKTKEIIIATENWLKYGNFNNYKIHSQWALLKLIKEDGYRFNIISQIRTGDYLSVYCNIGKSFTAKSTYNNKSWNNFIND